MPWQPQQVDGAPSHARTAREGRPSGPAAKTQPVSSSGTAAPARLASRRMVSTSPRHAAWNNDGRRSRRASAECGAFRIVEMAPRRTSHLEWGMQWGPLVYSLG